MTPEKQKSHGNVEIGQNVKQHQCCTPLYFILSSEIMENISAIKVVSIYSEVIWYHFTVD